MLPQAQGAGELLPSPGLLNREPGELERRRSRREVVVRYPAVELLMSSSS